MPKVHLNTPFKRSFSVFVWIVVLVLVASVCISLRNICSSFLTRSGGATERAVVTTLFSHRQNDVCQKINSLASTQKEIKELGFVQLCEGDVFRLADSLLNAGKHVHIVQIGAHVGFESNDPIAVGMGLYLQNLTAAEKQLVQWTFVEPSPPNYKRLVQNLAQPDHAALCHMHSVNAGVVSDKMNTTERMTFYSLSETIDPVTGYDSKSGITLPSFITQVSSFSKAPIMFNRGVFRRNDLNVHDYIVETPVTTLRYSDLMKDILKKSGDSKGKQQPPLFVLIDTEGFDCDIVLGISEHSSYWPNYLIFERHQCGAGKLQQTNAYLERLGYVVQEKGQNAIAIKKELLP